MATEPLAYLNGCLILASQAAISLDDLGFVWGATVTDRLRTFRQKLFRPEDHLRRFRLSCERAFVSQPRSDRELAEAAEELVAANAKHLGVEDELSLVLLATPGIAGEPTLAMQARPLEFARYRHLFVEGAILEPTARTLPPGMLDSHIKHRSRLAWWIAQQEIRSRAKPDAAVAEPLLTTAPPDQFIRETPTANVIVEMDGALVSPPRSEVLEGISLRVAEELCKTLGIPFAERELSLNEVERKAGECLLSCTSYCLAPVAQVGGVIKPAGGPLFQRLIQAWGDMVGVDIRRQFSL